MRTFFDVEQNTDEWNELRLKRFTASMASDLFMAKTTAGYRKAIIKVAYEIVTGESEENFSNKWMQRGHDKEPIAVENYENYTFRETSNGGFWTYGEYCGASPDRKIEGMNAGIEIKCPSFQIYDEYLSTGKIPKDYMWQIQMQLLCTGFDFIDFYPFSSPNLKQILTTVYPDNVMQDQLKLKLSEVIQEVKEKVKQIKNA